MCIRDRSTWVYDLINSLSALKKLEEVIIELEHCQDLTDATVVSISEAVISWSKLRVLHLTIGSPTLTNTGILRLSESLCRLKQLSSIKLKLGSSSLFSDDGSFPLFTTISSFPLTCLKLKFAKCPSITDQSIIRLLPFSEIIEKLTLDFSGASIADNCLKAVADSLYRLKSLTNLKLNLSHTGISKDGIQQLTEILQSSPKLSKLVLNFEQCKICLLYTSPSPRDS
eukprot:TRINITY_DN10489_c0_g1_i1.p1 TRINITY_DN10489_c0_g1~~TRINITY_DN10489_c0_g1_i1.p1  ORF type:complete len:227 (+),score=10.58 TRINITY_DN10489_c0_g1_i1:64-744(+)